MNNALPLRSPQKLHGYDQMCVDKGHISAGKHRFPKGGFHLCYPSWTPFLCPCWGPGHTYLLVCNVVASLESQSAAMSCPILSLGTQTIQGD